MSSRGVVGKIIQEAKYLLNVDTEISQKIIDRRLISGKYMPSHPSKPPPMAYTNPCILEISNIKAAIRQNLKTQELVQLSNSLGEVSAI